MTISVVIPTWNEAVELPETLRRLRAVDEVREILVSDAGSTDATVSLATAAGARVIAGARGRGGQLRRGAAAATGAVVWMVHADTWVEPEAGRAIRAALADVAVVGGACLKEFRDPPWLTRGSAWRCAVRMRWFQFAYGDQAIFIRRDLLTRIGGVPDVPLMEEFELCARMRRVGRLTLAGTVVTTSARRFRSRGVLRGYLNIAAVKLGYRFGMSPETLRRIYERV
jgi:rSAM/selenodomain-associated transferase 2